MLSFIVANLATIIVGAVVFAVLAFIIFKAIQSLKKSATSCGTGCSGCPNAKQCGRSK